MMAKHPSKRGNGDSGMAALGELICRLNPYTGQPWSNTTGFKTGKMAVDMLPDAPGLANAKKDAAAGNALQDKHLTDIAKTSIEVARNYGAQWTFKGEVLTVKSAVRIPYRFPVQDEDGETLYWQTEYLLLGYAGSDGA
jgi:hypothetical protein